MNEHAYFIFKFFGPDQGFYIALSQANHPQTQHHCVLRDLKFLFSHHKNMLLCLLAFAPYYKIGGRFYLAYISIFGSIFFVKHWHLELIFLKMS
jgi:hypothetical protein